ncbi:hypothetical protein AVEN_214944-1 [Araneus ventricosus]|uniref:DUF4817 domain-containing protein n=1 Tax=Araneus ventricosus TaxID=182803 RepID=A0A4Y2D959_ARAVE|nr:hypothetical protein AVEN_214944-1 [Araneus ventricosus]
MPWRLRRITSRWSNDYFLFPKLKDHLPETRFSSESDVKTVVENWFHGQDRILQRAEQTEGAKSGLYEERGETSQSSSTTTARWPKTHIVERFPGETPPFNDWPILDASGQWLASNCPHGYSISPNQLCGQEQQDVIGNSLPSH